jgi:hypothetical protein
MAAIGDVPYSNLPNGVILPRILSGYRLPKPEDCCSEMWVHTKCTKHLMASIITLSWMCMAYSCCKREICKVTLSSGQMYHSGY